MGLADKCETRSQTVQNEQFATEHASLFPPSKRYLMASNQHMNLFFFSFFLLSKFPFNQSYLPYSNTISYMGQNISFWSMM